MLLSIDPLTSSNESDFNESLAGKYLSARFAQNNNQSNDAAQYIISALAQDPENPELLELAFKLMILSGDIGEAKNYAAPYRELHPESYPAILVEAIAAIEDDAFVEAEQILSTIYDTKNPHIHDLKTLTLPLMITWTKVGQEKHDEALAFLTSIKDAAVFREFINYQRALIADLAGLDEEAHALYTGLLEDDRYSYRLVKAAAGFFYRKGNPDLAESIIAEYRKRGGSMALDELNKPLIQNAQEGVAELLLESAGLLYKSREHEVALMALQLALYLQPDQTYGQLLLGTILEKRQQYQQAMQAFQSIPQDSHLYEKVQVNIARNLVYLDRTEEAKKLLRKVAQQYPSQHGALIKLAEILLQDKQYSQSATVYSEVLQAIESPKREHWSIYFARGIAYERTDQWEKAEKDFLKVLELEPNHPEVLNYLAYSWIIQRKNLEDAKNMLRMAVAASPHDPHIIDSYGWALYALGNYKDAVIFLEKANLMMPYDPTINDHLGDVYWRLERYREARFQWKRALEYEPEEKDIPLIRAKLESGLDAIPSVATTTSEAPVNTP